MLGKVYGPPPCPKCGNNLYYIYKVIENNTNDSSEKKTFPAICEITCSLCGTYVHGRRIQTYYLGEAEKVS